MKRPLVVLDALLVRPRPAGVGRAILDWTCALAAEERFCDFAVLCAHPWMFAEVSRRPGWHVVPCHGAGGSSLRKAVWTQIAMPRLLRRLSADLLHSLQFVAPLRAPCPTVVTVYDLGYLHHGHTTEEPRRTFYRWLVPRSLRTASAVACVSDATAQDVRSVFPYVADRLQVTPLGVPTWVQRRPTRPAVKDETAPFLFVGTLEPRKNLERLLCAYQDFRRQRQRLNRACPRLVIVGQRGWKDRSLRRSLAAATDEGGVVVKGYCSQEELWRQYGLALALLFPSLHEGFGLPILEAMAAGTAVVTSDRGATAEVAGDAALLVDPLDHTALVGAMSRLVDEPELVRELEARGRENLCRWSWSRTAEITCEIYRRVLSAAGGAAIGRS